jgi:hypothetical protein
LQGNASTNYSATLTVQLNITETKFNWCAYASDYPPNAASYNNGTYTLKGTRPFVINGATVDAKTYAGVINSMTDATGCPGGVGWDVVHNGGSCAPGLTAVGSYCRDLVADEAVKFAGCGYEMEVKKSNIEGPVDWTTTYNCPAGWKPPTIVQYVCMWQNARATTNMTARTLYASAETATMGYKLHVSNCMTIDSYYAIYTAIDLGITEFDVCSTSHGTDYYILRFAKVGNIARKVKCVR